MQSKKTVLQEYHRNVRNLRYSLLFYTKGVFLFLFLFYFYFYFYFIVTLSFTPRRESSVAAERCPSWIRTCFPGTYSSGQLSLLLHVQFALSRRRFLLRQLSPERRRLLGSVSSRHRTLRSPRRWIRWSGERSCQA